jgi:hypothetical protein
VIEHINHSLAFTVRVDDAFADTPVAEQLEVIANDVATPVLSPDRGGTRQSDGTYRFLSLAPGTYQIKVTSPRWFTWTPTTPVTLPLADRRQAVVIPLWPSTIASPPLGVIAIRGALVSAPAGQEVRIDPVATPPLGKRSRCDAAGEFLYVIPGWTELEPVTGLVDLSVVVTGRTVTSVDVHDGTTMTTYPGSTFSVPPGRETRARFHLL